jgi:D-glycero-alpha-D-manno-heptose-7-phosphate kinase
MIITRTPFRVSLGGGGTDLPSFYERHEGFVISAAIDKHVYVSINRSFRQGFLLKYSELEQAATAAEIRHRLIREAVGMLGLEPPVEIVSVADVPAGTGLGSSGSFTVGLLHAIAAYQHRSVGAETLARQAVEVEMVRLGDPVGKQDPYIAAYGGLTCQHYHADGSVTITPLKVSAETIGDLTDNLLLFFTGASRNAADVLRDQKERSQQGDAAMLANLQFIKSVAHLTRTALESGDTETFGRLMHEHWERKQARSRGISDDRINALYELGRAHGAVGGKLVGAGGGGFLMFYASDARRLRRAMAEAGLQEMRFAFDFEGSIVLCRS